MDVANKAGFFTVVAAGFRTVCFLPVNLALFAVGPQALVGLILLPLLARLLVAVLIEGPEGEWALDNLGSRFFPVGITLVFALLAAGRAAKQVEITANLGLICSLQFNIELLYGLLLLANLWSPGFLVDIPIFTIKLLWLGLASMNVLAKSLQLKGRKFIEISLLTFFILLLPLWLVPWNLPLWVEAQEQAEDSYDPKYDALREEDAFYQQPLLLEKALSGIGQQDPRRTELFFVGMAGDADQAVFLREIESVRDLMEACFATGGHAVVLANSYQSAQRLPIASVTALRRALQRVAANMDIHQDVLFLYLTSHGSKSHEFTLEFWPLQFHPLNPEVLKSLLDETGIRWRVIVVSACYSGGYIEPLQDDHSIVITAAAPDRNSFGCSDEEEWTYFGKAFFDQALRQDRDLLSAFEMAKAIISHREKEEHVEKESMPMIAVGEGMQRKWREFLQENWP